MGIDDQSTDLRLLSLLHALRDGEEFVREVRRLLKSPSMDELHWRNICDMGRELAPQNQLFDPGRSYRDHQIEAAEAESGDGRRIVYDRRQGENGVWSYAAPIQIAEAAMAIAGRWSCPGWVRSVARVHADSMCAGRQTGK